MTRVPFPSTPPKGPQVECCALCQRLVNADELFYADVQGLRGLPICIYHGDISTEPGWSDLLGANTALIEAVNEAVREPPFGDEVWWDANGTGCLLLGDGLGCIVQTDHLSGIRLD